jgi:hypothetical protein
MNNYNARIQDLILEINETLAPKHFQEGHPEPAVFQHYRREVIDCPTRPMGCLQLDLSVKTLIGQDQLHSDITVTIDTNAHTTCNDGWMNFHAHLVNFEMRSRGKMYAPLTLRIPNADREDGDRMIKYLAGLLQSLKE